MLDNHWGRPIAALVFGAMAWVGHGMTGKAEDETPIKTISWRTSYADAADEAAERGRPLLIEFTAVWCGACRQMQQLTFSDRRVIEYVDKAYVPLVVDADEHAELVSGFRVEAFPTTLVVSPELKIVKRFTGYQSASTLLPELETLVHQHFAGNEVIQPVSAARPANATPFAFEGFCLVGILDDHKLRRGKPDFKATYRDQEVCFYSEEHLKKFLANPEKYWPAANGKCLVSEREGHQNAVGDPRNGVTWRGKLWLFSDPESQRRFIRSPQKYVSGG
jgi:YHS domain-containing protein